MKKIVPLLFLLNVFLVSCDDDVIMTSGQHIIAELQSVIAEKNITEVLVIQSGQDGYYGGSSDFSFFDESIRVESRYYNVNRITTYSVDTYTKVVNGNEFEIKRLVIEIDLL